ncbi:MAG: hypothetical protein SGJ09_02025 [Phycisphaerae bacterium]|nr:hypothetical protein [Phycisphaerae bacterium]
MPTPLGGPFTIRKFELVFLAFAAGVVGGVIGGFFGGWLVSKWRPPVVGGTSTTVVAAVGVPVKVAANPSTLTADVTTIAVTDIFAPGAVVTLTWSDASVFQETSPLNYVATADLTAQFILHVKSTYIAPNVSVPLNVTVNATGSPAQTATTTVIVNPSP